MKKQDKNIIFGISEKKDGQMKLLDNPVRMIKEARKNRRVFFEHLGLDSGRIVSAGQKHGAVIKQAQKKDGGKLSPNCDGLYTQEKNLILTITGADCLPVVIYDKRGEFAGIVHAGWQGVLKQAPLALARRILSAAKCSFRDLKVYIGPHIKQKDFEIGANLIKRFEKYPNIITIKQGKYFVDLAGAVIEDLCCAGLEEKNISVSPHSTYSSEKKFFSFRRDQPKYVEAMIAYVLKKK